MLMGFIQRAIRGGEEKKVEEDYGLIKQGEGDLGLDDEENHYQSATTRKPFVDYDEEDNTNSRKPFVDYNEDNNNSRKPFVDYDEEEAEAEDAWLDKFVANNLEDTIVDDENGEEDEEPDFLQ